MKTTRTLLLALVLASALSFEASAQSNFWSVNTESRAAIPTDKAVARPSYPKEFKLFNLNIEPLRQQLFSIVATTLRAQRSLSYRMPTANTNNLRSSRLPILNRLYRRNFLTFGLIPAKALRISMQL